MPSGGEKKKNSLLSNVDKFNFPFDFYSQKIKG